MPEGPLVAIGPSWDEFFADAVARGGGNPVPLTEGGRSWGVGAPIPGHRDEPFEGLVWLSPSAEALEEVLRGNPRLHWAQLPSAGVERFADGGIFLRWPRLIWTCAKGSYARPVAEHALALALAGLRHLPKRARATSWGSAAGLSLYGQEVTVLGAGGICQELLALLVPFGVRATVVRRGTEPVPGAAKTLALADLPSALPGALVVFVALSLTPETTGVIGARELSLMGPAAWLVNVARGRHVVTGDLVDALSSGSIGGAALDVTDPEPLPEGHALWSLPNCLITPHTADTEEMTRPLLAARVEENVRALGSGGPFMGRVDPALGY